MNKLPMLKSILAAVLLTMTTLAQADQCQLVSVEQAAKALNHIKPASQYVAFWIAFQTVGNDPQALQIC